MSQSALNDLSSSSEDNSEEEEGRGQGQGQGHQRPEAIRFEPRLDLRHFQQYLREEEENSNSNAIPSSAAALSQADLQRLQQLQQMLLAQEGSGHGAVRGDEGHTLSTISGHAGGGSSLQLGQAFSRGPAHSTHLLGEPSVPFPGKKVIPRVKVTTKITVLLMGFEPLSHVVT